MRKKYSRNMALLAIAFFFLLLQFVSAVDFTPQGNINLRDHYNITGALYVNSTTYYGDGSQLTGISAESSNASVWIGYNATNSTQFENVDGALTIVTSWFSALFNSLFGFKTTDDLTEGSTNLYDNKSWNESHADSLYVNIDGDTMIGDLTFADAGIQQANYLQLNTSFEDGFSEGRLQWDSDFGVPEIGLAGINGKLFLQTLRRVRAAEDLEKGDVVYACGVSGSRAEVCKASNDNVTKSFISGIVMEDFSTGQSGYLINNGFITDIDTTINGCATSSYVWLGLDGNYTCIRPTSPNAQTAIGGVIRSHATEGIIDVKIVYAQRMTGLSDTYLEIPTDDEFYQWDNADSRFELTDSPNFENVTAQYFIGDGSYLTDVNFTETDPIWSSEKSDYYTSTQTNTAISSANTSMKNYVDAQDVVFNNSMKSYVDGTFITDLSGFDTDDLSEGSSNLYSQWLDSGSNVYYSAGNVGVGIAPTAKLHVYDSGSVTNIFQVGTGDGGATGDINLGYNGYGWYWHYAGDGSGDNNELQLWSEGAGGTDDQVYGIKQSGIITFYQTLKALDWSNVSITESQISDLGSYALISNLVSLVGNWSADKSSYSTTAEADALYAGIEWDYNQTTPAVTIANAYTDSGLATQDACSEITGCVENAITSVVEDTTPQLGGYLDTNGQNIGSTADEIENIYIATNSRIYFGDGQEASIYYNGTALIGTG